jgi:NAD(P)-dependent dehydrogenase (short-subunit alcohol dehydrogenase family)
MILDLFSLAGRVAVVTGAGRGIGAAIAGLAGKRGYAVCVNYARSRDAAETLAAGINAGGGKAVAIQADVSVESEATRLFAEVDRALGRVDVLVNNAGIIGRQCRVDEMDPALLAEVFAANVYSTFYCSREALRRMSTKHGGKGGAIVNISSVAARHGGPPWSRTTRRARARSTASPWVSPRRSAPRACA